MTKENKFSVVLVEPKNRESDKSVLRSYAPLMLEVTLDVSGKFDDPVVGWKYKNMQTAIEEIKSHMESICAEYQSVLSLSMVETEVMGQHKIKVCHRTTDGMKDADSRRQSYMPYAHWEGDTLPVHLWAANSFKSVTLKWGEVEVKITPTEAMAIHNSLSWEGQDANPYIGVEGTVSDLLFSKAEKAGISITKSSDYLKSISSLKMASIKSKIKEKADMLAALADPRLANLPACSAILRDILDAMHMDSIALNDTVTDMVYAMAEGCVELVDTKGRNWASEKVEDFIAECELALEYLGADTDQDRIYGFNKFLSCIVRYKGEKPSKFSVTDKELKLMLNSVGMYPTSNGLTQDLDDVNLDVLKMQELKGLLLGE